MSKVWFITGSSRGFGRSLAEAVLENGDQLVATARKPEQLNDLVEKYGERVRTFALDVTDPAKAQEAVDFAIDEFGTIDVLVNNAGYGNIASIEETTFEDFRDQINTNLWGVIHVTKAALPALRRQGRGHIIQFSSIGGRVGSPGLAAYQAAKWAVEGFSEVLAKEIEPLGLKVTIIEPGGFRTDWAGSSMATIEPREEYRDTVGNMIAHARSRAGKENGDPRKAAQAIITIVNETNPPLRLLLGTDAFLIAKVVDRAKLTETELWGALSRSTDFEGAKLDPALEAMFGGLED